MGIWESSDLQRDLRDFLTLLLIIQTDTRPEWGCLSSKVTQLVNSPTRTNVQACALHIRAWWGAQVCRWEGRGPEQPWSIMLRKEG